MGRRRAGHGYSWSRRGERSIPIIGTADGGWITTGEAQGWTRCQRCRKPEQSPQTALDGRTVCVTCYYYECLPKGEFWTRERDYLFPYNIGRRGKSPPETIARPKYRAARETGNGGGDG